MFALYIISPIDAVYYSWFLLKSELNINFSYFID
jgi:hypothetical protein